MAEDDAGSRIEPIRAVAIEVSSTVTPVFWDWYGVMGSPFAQTLLTARRIRTGQNDLQQLAGK